MRSRLPTCLSVGLALLGIPLSPNVCSPDLVG
jgi:hypothetical protein